MELQKEASEGIFIQSFSEGTIVIANKSYTKSVIVTPTAVIDHWSPQSVQEITEKDILSLLEYEPELILLGTGMELVFPAKKILMPAYESQVGVEVMRTAEASGTFNLLISDGRKVVAGLLVN